MMPETQWFDVNLETLRLAPADLSQWPEGMGAATSRMKEECLESLVALNLDVLFPGENLLLVATQSQLMPMADVTAMDSLGMLRVMEVKKTAVGRNDLDAQVLSYAVAHQRFATWQELLAEVTADIPELLALAIEGLRTNRRVKSMGEKAIAESLPEIRWATLNRFQRNACLIQTLRRERGESRPLDVLGAPGIETMCQRLFGLPVRDVALGNPPQVVERIQQARWRLCPAQHATEFVLLAPGLAGGTRDLSGLEERGARFCLIDAELRGQPSVGGVTRAVLRWEPVRRTVDAEAYRQIVALQQEVCRTDPHAAALRWHGGKRTLDWPELGGPFLKLETRPDGHTWLVTQADWVTEGRADLAGKRIAAVRALGERLRNSGVDFVTRSDVGVRWQPELVATASEMLIGYYRTCRDLGFGDRYRWHRRLP